jgi:hypothetical protein
MSNLFIIEPNIMDNARMQQLPFGPNKLLPLVFQSGLELKENIYVDGQWRIEHYSPNFAIQCSTLQKTTMVECKTKINLCKFVNGTPIPCYLGF